MRTIYFSPEMDKYIDNRAVLEDRKRSAVVERMLRKCRDFEAEADMEVAMGSESSDQISD